MFELIHLEEIKFSLLGIQDAGLNIWAFTSLHVWTLGGAKPHEMLLETFLFYTLFLNQIITDKVNEFSFLKKKNFVSRNVGLFCVESHKHTNIFDRFARIWLNLPQKAANAAH